MRETLLDPELPTSVRVAAIDALLSEGSLRHEDLLQILENPYEPLALRCEAAEKSVGISEMVPVIVELLSKEDMKPELSFWCLYALGVFTG